MIALQGLRRPPGPPLELSRERLDRHVGDPESEPGRDAEQHAGLGREAFDQMRHDQQQAEADGDALEDDHPASE